jgi:hypothetical protein
MKEIKLTPVEVEYSPKDKFIVVVTFMHGDADKYDYEEYECKDEADFRRIVDKLNDAPQNPSEGGDDDAYDEWALETFTYEDFIPYDVVYPGKCSYDGFEAFYYDSNGVKFKAEI